MILKVLKEKASLKQDVYFRNIEVFKMLREVSREISKELKPKATEIDKRLIVEFRDKSEFEFELRVAGDVLIFSMHTNVVRDNEGASYCGMINIYNFLADSFKYSRSNDLGYLVARIFINFEDHFFVEGKRQLGFLYNDFANSVISKDQLRNIVESAILYCLDFDLFTPPFDEVKVITLGQVQEANALASVKTGKRLGFRFQADTDLE